MHDGPVTIFPTVVDDPNPCVCCWGKGPREDDHLQTGQCAARRESPAASDGRRKVNAPTCSQETCLERYY